MVYSVYILKSEKGGGYYFGHTKDVDNRLREHNRGKVRSTKGRIPFGVHNIEEFETKSEAFQREMFFKTLEGRI